MNTLFVKDVLVAERQRTLSAVISAVRQYQRDPSLQNSARLACLGLRRLDGGFNNTVYAHQGEDQPLCIKVYRVDDRHRAEREWTAISFLAEHGCSVAPKPIAYEPDACAPVVVMEHVEGVHLRQHMPGPVELRALAAALRKLQSLTPSVANYPHTVVGAPAMLMDRVIRCADELEASDDDPVARVALPLIRRWLDSHEPAILRKPAAVVFSRGDPNLANCLWDGRRVRFVDFEYAGWSDVAFDIADLVEGPWARQVGDAEWDAFVAEHFDLSVPETRLRYTTARRFFTLFWVCLLWQRRESLDAGDLLAKQVRRAEMMQANG